ncbi:hypothetical protein EXIGLDRAFT_780327 [Exidia glandulosa HHB12029]|uniref:Uncharacterized protein n=1 Tax=Exidia glandulosa HHB12029 TaxID=1314781 RepID=A0A165BNB7_EXIGL|nr:hypothetical protein EXIGLDRAFT_780327 [Exidia glandulosa HHB12029]
MSPQAGPGLSLNTFEEAINILGRAEMLRQAGAAVPPPPAPTPAPSPAPPPGRPRVIPDAHIMEDLGGFERGLFPENIPHPNLPPHFDPSIPPPTMSLHMVWRLYLEGRAHLLAEPTPCEGSNPYPLDKLQPWIEYARYLAHQLWVHSGEAGVRSLVSSLALQLWDGCDRVTLLQELGEYSDDPSDLQSKWGWNLSTGGVTRNREEAADFRRELNALNTLKESFKEIAGGFRDELRAFSDRLDVLFVTM